LEDGLKPRYVREQYQIRQDIAEILARADALPILSTASEDENLGYDENGIPETYDKKHQDS